MNKTVATNIKNNGISIYEYVASNNPKGCVDLLLHFGFPEEKLPSDLLDYKAMGERLKYMVKNVGENFAMEFVGIHPDLTIVEDYLKNKNVKVEEGDKKTVTASLNKETAKETAKSTTSTLTLSPQTQNILLGVGFTIMGIGIVMAVAKAVK